MEIDKEYIENLLENEKFSKNGIQLLQFVLSNGRLPGYRDKNELKLFFFCSRISRNVRGMREKYPSLYPLMKSLGWLGSAKEKTERKVREFWSFVEENGRLPKYGVREEKSLYEWCAQLATGKKRLAERYPDVYQKITEMRDRMCTRSSLGNSPEKKFFFTMKFIEKNGRLPKERAKDIEERALAGFCHRVIANKNGMGDRFPKLKKEILLHRNSMQERGRAD